MRKFILLVTLLLATTITSLASTVTVAWDLSNSTDVAGYKVYYQLDATTTVSSVDVGNVSSFIVTNLKKRKIYNFWVTAYNSSGESVPSNTVSVKTK